MEKLTGPKHNHLFTDLLKVAIFGLMLLLPFLCFLPTGFYYGFNEHATNETTTEINYKYQSNEVNTASDLVVGNIYHYPSFTIDTHNNIYFDIFIISASESNNAEGQIDYIDDFAVAPYFDYVAITYNEDELYFDFGSTTGYVDLVMTYYYNELSNVDLIFNELPSNDFINAYGLPTISTFNVIESVETNVQDTISNKMYQAWQGVWTSPLFNWTNTTPLNTGLNGFVSIFGINQSSYIANCLIYLLSITAIYVVFDIVLGIFKWLTHLINK